MATLSLQQVVETDGRVALQALPHHPELVRQVQQCLYECGLLDHVDSVYGPQTEAALRRFCRDRWLDTFQRGELGPTLAKALLEVLHPRAVVPVNRVEPTLGPKGELGELDYRVAAQVFRVEPAVLRAVVEVESAGRAFDSKGRPVILFEAHWFSYLTQHKYDLSHPRVSSRRWNPGLYRQGDGEWQRLEVAASLDPTAAYLATSWGLGQVLGLNYDKCGYATVRRFVQAMHESALLQLQAMLAFIEHQGLLPALRRRRWDEFARVYNGPDYQRLGYVEKLEQAYRKYQP